MYGERRPSQRDTTGVQFREFMGSHHTGSSAPQASFRTRNIPTNIRVSAPGEVLEEDEWRLENKMDVRGNKKKKNSFPVTPRPSQGSPSTFKLDQDQDEEHHQEEDVDHHEHEEEDTPRTRDERMDEFASHDPLPDFQLSSSSSQQGVGGPRKMMERKRRNSFREGERLSEDNTSSSSSSMTSGVPERPGLGRKSQSELDVSALAKSRSGRGEGSKKKKKSKRGWNDTDEFNI